jgi:large subunit ribosomal protein L15
MQNKRAKRSRIRAARRTAGHGSKKKHRGSGHRGGFGQSSMGKRGSGKIMKVTKGKLDYLGKHGFKTLNKKEKTITLQEIQDKLATLLHSGLMTKDKETFTIDLSKTEFDKLLSKGAVKIKLHIKVGKATENAIAKVEAAGGKVELLTEESEGKSAE